MCFGENGTVKFHMNILFGDNHAVEIGKREMP
jgi:hypothetical protein